MTIGPDDDQNTINSKVKNTVVPHNESSVDGGTGTPIYKNGMGPGKMIKFDDSSAITAPLDHIRKFYMLQLFFREKI